MAGSVPSAGNLHERFIRISIDVTRYDPDMFCVRYIFSAESSEGVGTDRAGARANATDVKLAMLVTE